MRNTPDRGPETRGRHSLDRARPQPPGSRTATAGLEFLKAVGSDLACLAAQLWRFLTAERKQSAATLPPNTTASSGGTSRPRSAGQSLRRLVLGIALAVVGGMTIVSGALLWALLGPPVDKPASEPPKPTLLLEAANGEPLGRVGSLRVADVPLQEFPPILIKAVLSTEDRRFYDNIGVDPAGILRAAFANRAAGGVVQGGSTITQQLVKLQYLNGDRTYIRK